MRKLSAAEHPRYSVVRLVAESENIGHMPLLRLLFAGLIAFAAMAAVFFAAVVVFFTGAVAWVLQRLRPRRRQAWPAARRRAEARESKVIDI